MITIGQPRAFYIHKFEFCARYGIYAFNSNVKFKCHTPPPAPIFETQAISCTLRALAFTFKNSNFAPICIPLRNICVWFERKIQISRHFYKRRKKIRTLYVHTSYEPHATSSFETVKKNTRVIGTLIIISRPLAFTFKNSNLAPLLRKNTYVIRTHKLWAARYRYADKN